MNGYRFATGVLVLGLALGCGADTPIDPLPETESPRRINLAQNFDVGVLAYCTDLTGNFGAENAANTLMADGRFASATVVDADVDQPTAAEMEAQFDCVMAMTDDRCGGEAPGSAALADYANNGNGLLLATFGFHPTVGFVDEVFAAGVSPFQPNPATPAPPFASDQEAVDVDGASVTPPCDDIFGGVPAFNSRWWTNVDLATGALLCASYANGEEFLAVNAAGNVIGVNFFPNDANNNTQDGFRQLMGNAMHAACEAGAVPPPPENMPPVAGFTSSCTGLTCDFTDTSTDADGTIASWFWDFGDGATSTAQNPSHTYASGGTFTVTLTVTDDDGASDDVSQDVSVVAPPPPPPPGPTCNGQSATPGVRQFTFFGTTFWIGTSGPDVIVGGPGRDVVTSLGGDDVICTNGGNDGVHSGPGSDQVDLGPGADTASTGSGPDALLGGDGNDRVSCGHTGDPNSADLDTDTFDGGPGSDLGTLCEVETNVEE